MIDTSFLMAFSDPGRSHHDTANWYWHEFKRRLVPMFLSTIALAEFAVRQSISDLPLRSFHVLPFNVDHAKRCGALSESLRSVTDDIKLVAQCVAEGIDHLITDGRTLGGALQARAPRLTAILLKDGIDASWFDGGQRSLL